MRIIKILTAFSFIFALFVSGKVEAQADDGDMQVIIRFEEGWNETGDDIWPDRDEFTLRIRVRDYPDLDGSSWFYSSVLTYSNSFASTGPFLEDIPDWSRTFTYGSMGTLAPGATPLGLQTGFEGWEDDCYSCAGGTICLSSCSSAHGRTTYEASCPCSCECLFTGGDDQYCNREHNATSYISFRGGPPYTYSYRGVVHTGMAGFTASCGSDDVGAGYSTFWTSPSPDTFFADRPVICEPGFVTLQAGGAVFGGSYRWYRETSSGPILVLETIDSFLTVFVDTVTTYRVYTRNSGQESWSYRQLTIGVDQPNITSIVPTHPLCADSSNGTITINATTLYGPLSYSVDNGASFQSSNTFSLPAGFYFVRIRTPYCVFPSLGIPVQLIDPAPFETRVASIDSVRCAGTNDGGIDISVSGGTPPISFNWSSGAVTEDLTLIGPGLYSLTATDDHGCVQTESVTLTAPSAISLSMRSSNVSCHGVADGWAAVDVSGGSAPYSYQWSTFELGDSIAHLSGGSYRVIVTDRYGCVATDSVTIIEPTELMLNFGVTDIICAGTPTGAIDLSVSGGVPAYTYSWSNGAFSEDISLLAAGTYVVTVTDAVMCQKVDSATVNSGTILSVSSTKTDVLCNGLATGSVDISVSGGVGPYSFNWSTGAVTEDVTSLTAGTYYVTVTDAVLCSVRDTFIISEPTAITVNLNIHNPNCNGINDGSAQAIVSGGVAPYRYLWSTFSIADSVYGLGDGPIGVIVTDANGCQEIRNGNVVEPAALSLVLNVSQIDCYGAANGQITTVVSGGTGGISYNWNTGASSASLTSLNPGTYSVTITDSVGCSNNTSAGIIQPDSIAVTAIVLPVLCNGHSDGNIDLFADGGTGPLSYLWNTGASVQDLNRIGGGTYTVTVTDRNACTKVRSYTVTEPSLLIVNLSKHDLSCAGSDDGSIQATVSGGVTPYRYQWSTSVTTDSISHLISGFYSLTVTDANNCTAYASSFINEANPIVLNADIQDLLCNSDNSGSIDLSIVGGISPYSYTWSNGGATEDISSLNAGIFVVNVTDGAGCTATANFTVEEPDVLTADLTKLDASCTGSTNGFILADAYGGTPPYSYQWNTSPMQYTALASNLGAGTYSLTLNDDNNCQFTDSVQILESGALSLSLNPIDASCVSAHDGRVTIHVQGGQPPFYYSMNGLIQPDSIFENLNTDAYLVVVEDANGCRGVDSFEIFGPDGYDVDLRASKRYVVRGEEVYLYGVTTSPSAVVSYQWTPDENLNFINCTDTNLCDEAYTTLDVTTSFILVTTNADGCKAFDTLTVIVTDSTILLTPTAFTPNEDGLNETFSVFAVGADKVEVSIYDRWGNLVYYNENQESGSGLGWDGKYQKSGKKCPMGIYTYMLKVLYFDGRDEVRSGTITLIR